MPGDDRDQYSPKTPPPDVAEQIARPSQRADSSFGADEPTPVFGDPITRIEKRTKDASGASRAAFAAIREHRVETRDQYRMLNDRSDKLSDKIDAVQSDMSDIKGVVGELSGKMDIIAQQHSDTQKALLETTTLKIKAETDLETHRQKAELELTTQKQKSDIETDAEVKKHTLLKWGTIFKVAGAFGIAVASVIGTISLAGVHC